ncbi:HAMP domain-containing protein [bacterium]|nr:MAG: HAMP domain-containing protein [bacterium]
MRSRLAFKVFAAIFSITAATLALTGSVILRRIAADSERDYLRHYANLAGQIGDTLNQLDKTTDLIAINALNAFREKERRGGLLSNAELARLRDELKMENLYILDRRGVFQRSDWYITVAEDPKLRAFYGGKPPLTTSLFSYCKDYRNLVAGTSTLERTPIIPNPPGLPYERINKYLMVPNHDRSRILEASVSMDFIGEILKKALKPDKNVVSIGLYTPSGDALGYVHHQEKTPLSKQHLDMAETASLEPRTVGENFYFYAAVEPTVDDCCECKLKQLTLPNGRYYYLLKMGVSRTALLERLARLREIFLAFGLAALLLSVATAVLVSRKLVRRLEQMGAKIRQIAASDDLSLRVDAVGADEVGVLGRRFNHMLGQLESSRQKLASAERDRAYADLARQVAHDIRAPLAAMGSLVEDFSQLSAEKRGVVDGALGRIRDIASELLEKYRAKAPAAAEPLALAASVSAIVAEKAAKYRANTAVTLLWSPPADAGAFVATADRLDFERLVSNLVDNGVEALGGRGTVALALTDLGTDVRLEVHDDGRGIPPEVLGKLGRKGATFGKAGGSGLGLHHAKACAEAWGGSLQVRSEPGRGTTVAVTLPKASPPSAEGPVVLIDDDPLVRKTWEVAAKAKGKDLRAFDSAAGFLAVCAGFPPQTRVYLDSDLGGGERGEKAAAELHARGFRNLYLATGHAPEEFAGDPHIKEVLGKDPPWP